MIPDKPKLDYSIRVGYELNTCHVKPSEFLVYIYYSFNSSYPDDVLSTDGYCQYSFNQIIKSGKLGKITKKVLIREVNQLVDKNLLEECVERNKRGQVIRRMLRPSRKLGCYVPEKLWDRLITLSPVAFRVFLAIASLTYCNENDYLFVNKKLAEICHVSESTIKRSLNELLKSKVIGAANKTLTRTRINKLGEKVKTKEIVGRYIWLLPSDIWKLEAIKPVIENIEEGFELIEVVEEIPANIPEPIEVDPELKEITTTANVPKPVFKVDAYIECLEDNSHLIPVWLENAVIKSKSFENDQDSWLDLIQDEYIYTLCEFFKFCVYSYGSPKNLRNKGKSVNQIINHVINQFILATSDRKNNANLRTKFVRFVAANQNRIDSGELRLPLDKNNPFLAVTKEEIEVTID